jgi:hypothetical protein
MILCDNCRKLGGSNGIISFTCEGCGNTRFAQGIKPVLCDVCAVGKGKCQFCRSSLDMTKENSLDVLNAKYHKDTFYSKIKGVTMAADRQKNLMGLLPGQQLFFLHEKSNPVDPNAIRLFADKDLKVDLGYIGKDLTPDLLSFMYDHGVRFGIFVSEVTGGGVDRSLGCNIQIKLYR